MREVKAAFDEAGIQVRFVAIGTPDLVRSFCSQFGDPEHCIADAGKRSYKAMGLEDYNLWRIFSDRALRERRNANKAAGFRQNWRATKMKDAAQLPGAAFIDRNGVIRWIYRGEHPGDLPSMAEMLQIVRGLHLV